MVALRPTTSTSLVWGSLFAAALTAHAQTSSQPPSRPTAGAPIFVALAGTPAGLGLPAGEPHIRYRLPPAQSVERRPALTIKGIPGPGRLLIVPTPEPTRPFRLEFKRLMGELDRIDRFDAAILAESARQGVDPRLVKAIIAAESDFRTQARSPRGARGLMQLMPSTARMMGLGASRLDEPEGSIAAGTAYIRYLYREAWKRYKMNGVALQDAPPWMLQRIIAAYNAGPSAMGRSKFRPETRSYVRKVLLFYGSDVSALRRPG
ncbi:MAG TPA: hypothetical protein DCM05_00780 [Elusimicrobia bacterium]|nr:hypothetical protein [Elusimicrobiota bacterium]